MTYFLGWDLVGKEGTLEIRDSLANMSGHAYSSHWSMNKEEDFIVMFEKEEQGVFVDNKPCPIIYFFAKFLEFKFRI